MMKYLIIIFSVVSLTAACNNNEERILNTENAIYGTWQLVESYIVSGVIGEWTSIENGYVYTINPDLTFQSSQFSECNEGTVFVSNTEISFDYNCQGFTAGIESPSGVFTYEYKIEDGMLNLNPTFLECSEGCGFRFEKISPDE